MLRAFALSVIVGAGLALSVTIGTAGTDNATSSHETTTTATTTSSTAAPTNTSPPIITGNAQEGQVLTADPGNWTGSPTSYAYQWLRCDAAGANCGSIAGATSQQYTVTTPDVGHRLRVNVQATNSGGSTTATSGPTDVVTAAGAGPANTAKPAVGGNPPRGPSSPRATAPGRALLP
jgi:hypothetical protein